jgi:hypothetical protein
MLKLDVINIISDKRSPSLSVLGIFLKLDEFFDLPSHVAPKDKVDAHVPFNEIEEFHDELI